MYNFNDLFRLVYNLGVMVRLAVFNATFNNISALSWRSALLAEETGAPWKNHRSVARHWQTLSHSVVLSTPCHEWDSNSQLWWWYGLIAKVVVNSVTIWLRPRRPRVQFRYIHTQTILNYSIYKVELACL